MHMADAFISPAVGGTLWVVSGGLIGLCARRVKVTLRDNLVPLMGMLGAFVFAAQMINFSIPGTGSSGHLGGGLLLAVILGPHAAFLVIASVLTVQALFFADGGLLALGCNLFNLGFFPAFVAYPLLYRGLARGQQGTPRAWLAAIVAAVVGLQLGAFCVVLQTTASGISSLPFQPFVGMLLPIHAAIGVVEGLATATVVAFIARARPDALQAGSTAPAPSLRPVMLGLALGTLLVGGVASWFASTNPDGLEWAIARVSGTEEPADVESGVHGHLADLQQKLAVMPDYGFRTPGPASPAPEAWPAVSAGTSSAGLVGGLMTLALAGLTGLALRWRTPPLASGTD